MVLLQLVTIAAGAFWVAAGVVLLARPAGPHPRRRRALGAVAVLVGVVVLAVVALWILALAPLSAARPHSTGFPSVP